MNYDFMTLINYFIGAFACCFGLFLVQTIISFKKLSELKFYHYILIILFSIVMIINTLIFDNVAKMFGILLILFFMFKLIYKENNVYSVVVSFFAYIILIITETSISIIIALFENIFNISILANFIKSILINFVIAIFSCLYAFLLRKKMSAIISKINHDNIVYSILLSAIIVLVAFSSMYNLYIANWEINYEFILNSIIIFGCLYILIVLIKQNIKNREITDKYSLMNEYMKTSADLIEKYSSTIHKYKNNLIAIKGYMKSDIKEANNYIDGLLDNYKTKKYNWFSKINYIKQDTIRYLVYYKLSKAEDLNLKISVDVSQEIKKISEKQLSTSKNNVILEILGELFDNAIYASNESESKELNFSLYEENKALVFIIANTYKGKIDMSSITKNGYTTKGKGHGFGLYDIEKSLKLVSNLNIKYELLDNYFMVTLLVGLKK